MAEAVLGRIGYDAEEARIIADHVVDAALCGYEYSGLPTRDPALVKSILPFGGYKGFALTLAMQALGVLAGSGRGDDKTYGYLIMAIQPDLMLPLDDFRRDTNDMRARVKATPRQPGVDEIRLPGEHSSRERARNLWEGIEIDRKIYEALLAVPQGKLPER